MKASLRGSPLDGDLWSYERVVWRDVIAAFGLVPDPKKCWSKPTHPRTVKRKNCFWDDVHGLINGSVTFQPWDLWWWRDARDWPALVQRYISAYKELLNTIKLNLRIYEHVNGTTNTTTYYYMVLTGGGHTYKARKQRQFGAPRRA